MRSVLDLIGLDRESSSHLLKVSKALPMPRKRRRYVLDPGHVDSRRLGEREDKAASARDFSDG